MAEAVDGGNSSEGAGASVSGGHQDSGLTGLLTSTLYLVGGLVVVLIVGAAAYWVGTWIVVDVRPSLEDIVGRVLLQTSSGLFIGAGFVGVIGALRLVRGLERRVVEPYYRSSSAP